MNSIFLNESEIEEIRRKVTQEEWASGLLEYLKKAIGQDPHSGAKPYEKTFPRSKVYAQQARDIAIVQAVTGEELYLDKMEELFRSVFLLDKMECDLATEPPPEVSGLNARHQKHWKPQQWSFGYMRGGFFYAYDLTRNHPLWQKNDLGARLEQRFSEILKQSMPRIANARGWANPDTWHSATIAMLGGLLGDDDAVDLAIEGPLGYKSILEILQDDRLWPEPIGYGMGYVRCVLSIIAEVARHTGREDLYRWETRQGVSYKNMFDGFLEMLFADGRLANHGDCGNGPRLWNGEGRSSGIFEMAYRVYRDPRYAWILAQSPQRDTRDEVFWGYGALTHGVPLGDVQPPDATGKIWRCYGSALVRGDESDSYWNSNAPAVYMRTGQPHGHGHSDTANILLNAYGRNLYPDISVGWSYQSRIDPKTGKDVNPSPFTKLRISHNTVSMDCTEPKIVNLPHLGDVRETGPMKVVILRVAQGERLRRTIGVTDQYVFDWMCVGNIVEPNMDTEHTFDYHLYGLGIPELSGVNDVAPYNSLNEEYGLGPIDVRSSASDNLWIRPGQAGATDSAWQAIMREERPLDPQNPRGVRIHMLGESGTQVITGNVPNYVSGEGWDATKSENAHPGRLGLLLVRRQAVIHTEYLAVHQPFCGSSPAPLHFSRQDNTLQVQGEDFCDTINLPAVTCRRDY